MTASAIKKSSGIIKSFGKLSRQQTVRFVFLWGLTIWTASSVQSQVDTLRGFLSEKEAESKAWLDDLYHHGVEIKGDSVYFNDETRRISTDSLYRRLIYPETYTWEMVSGLMHRKLLKPAFWYMINLYQSDTARRDLVFRMILPLDQTLEMDRALLAAFYTYIAFDPEVYTLVNGKTTEVKRPDIAEHKLLATKAIVEQVYAQRKRKASQTPKAE